jgi:hypothetical protein
VKLDEEERRGCTGGAELPLRRRFGVSRTDGKGIEGQREQEKGNEKKILRGRRDGGILEMYVRIRLIFV